MMTSLCLQKIVGDKGFIFFIKDDIIVFLNLGFEGEFEGGLKVKTTARELVCVTDE